MNQSERLHNQGNEQQSITPEGKGRSFVNKALIETVKAMCPIITSDNEFWKRLDDRHRKKFPNVTDAPVNEPPSQSSLVKYSKVEGIVLDLWRYAGIGNFFIKDDSSLLILGGYLSPTILHVLSKIPPEGKFGIAVHAAQAAGRAIDKAHAKLGL